MLISRINLGDTVRPSYHVIVNLQVHVTRLNSSFPNALITCLVHLSLEVSIARVCEIIEVAQVILVVCVCEPMYLIQISSVADQVSLQVAIEDGDRRWSTIEDDANHLETLGLHPLGLLGLEGQNFWLVPPRRYQDKQGEKTNKTDDISRSL